MKWKAAGVLAALAAGFASSAALGGALVKVDGSSTVYPITEAVAEEFQKAGKGAVRVTVGISGTGGGFKKFCRGETDISDASRPISKSEMEICRAAGIGYIELPVAFDALTVVIHPRNAFIKNLTVAELKKMWEPAAQGRVTKWNQVNPAWPAADMKLYGPGADSGTFEYFTEAVVGKAKSSRGDFTASEDDNVLVQGVSRDAGALGYFGYAYYAENKDKLKAVPIVNSKGKAVEPSAENVVNGSYEPLSRPIFIYVNVKAAQRPEVKGFVEYYLAQAARLVKEVKYVPLSDADYRHAAANFAKRKAGTAFGGHPEVGVKVADLLGREPKQ
ncbi:MAG: PstS family phosphate ABC transporter substrate-binding protein [Rhodocyclaceae bacterium]